MAKKIASKLRGSPPRLGIWQYFPAPSQRILRASKSLGKLACCNTYSYDDFDAKLKAGFEAITLKSEADFFMSAGRELLEEMRRRSVRRKNRSG